MGGDPFEFQIEWLAGWLAPLVEERMYIRDRASERASERARRRRRRRKDDSFIGRSDAATIASRVAAAGGGGGSSRRRRRHTTTHNNKKQTQQHITIKPNEIFLYQQTARQQRQQDSKDSKTAGKLSDHLKHVPFSCAFLCVNSPHTSSFICSPYLLVTLINEMCVTYKTHHV